MIDIIIDMIVVVVVVVIIISSMNIITSSSSSSCPFGAQPSLDDRTSAEMHAKERGVSTGMSDCESPDLSPYIYIYIHI